MDKLSMLILCATKCPPNEEVPASDREVHSSVLFFLPDDKGSRRPILMILSVRPYLLETPVYSGFVLGGPVPPQVAPPFGTQPRSAA